MREALQAYGTIEKLQEREARACAAREELVLESESVHGNGRSAVDPEEDEESVRKAANGGMVHMRTRTLWAKAFEYACMLGAVRRLAKSRWKFAGAPKRVWQELLRCPFFQELDPGAMRALLGCARYWSFPPGFQVAQAHRPNADDDCRALIVLSGALSVSHDNKEGEVDCSPGRSGGGPHEVAVVPNQIRERGAEAAVVRAAGSYKHCEECKSLTRSDVIYRRHDYVIDGDMSRTDMLQVSRSCCNIVATGKCDTEVLSVLRRDLQACMQAVTAKRIRATIHALGPVLESIDIQVNRPTLERLATAMEPSCQHFDKEHMLAKQGASLTQIMILWSGSVRLYRRVDERAPRPSLPEDPAGRGVAEGLASLDKVLKSIIANEVRMMEGEQAQDYHARFFGEASQCEFLRRLGKPMLTSSRGPCLLALEALMQQTLSFSIVAESPVTLQRLGCMELLVILGAERALQLQSLFLAQLDRDAQTLEVRRDWMDRKSRLLAQESQK